MTALRNIAYFLGLKHGRHTSKALARNAQKEQQ